MDFTTIQATFTALIFTVFQIISKIQFNLIILSSNPDFKEHYVGYYSQLQKFCFLTNTNNIFYYLCHNRETYPKKKKKL